MNDHSDIERVLTTWFDDGPSTMPDRVVDVVADRIGRQSQRRTWRLDWRPTTMQSVFKIGVGIAAVLAIAVVGWNLLPDGSAGIGGPGPTPSPSAPPLASPSPSGSPTASAIADGCATSDPACEGPLAAGRHSTNQLITPFTYQVPAGWLKTLDVPGSFNLEIRDAPEGIIAVVPDWAAASQSACIPSSPPAEAGVGHTADELVAWLTSHPGLTATAVGPVTIAGQTGQTLELAKKPEWIGPCPGVVSLFTHAGTVDDGGAWDIGDSTGMRLYVLDLPDGHTATVMVVVDPSTKFETIVRAATPVIESIVFE